MLSFKELRENKNLLYESVRGSHVFGLNTEASDIDTFGLFCCPKELLYGTGREYELQVESEKNDDTWWELKKFIEALGKSNPTALEALFTPDKWVLYYNPILDPLWEIRDQLITKASFKSFGSYAVSQIHKAKGLNKKINTNPEEVKERKSLLHFCWVPCPNSEGVWNMEKWLRENGLKEQHCGAVRYPNGQEFYCLFYDWFADKDLRLEDYARLRYGETENPEKYRKELEEGKKTEYIAYRGLLDPNNPSTQIRLSPISKEDSKHPLCSFQYNLNAFSSHCRKYKDYHEWVKNRNPARYELNKGHEFDAKNLSTCVRILTMAKEMAEGKGMLLDRSGIDRDFLLSIKNHEMGYEEIMKYTESLEKEMTKSFENSKLPDSPDLDLLEKTLINIRLSFYKK